MSKLYIEFARENGKTVVKDSFFTAPFKITKPFENGDAAEIMIMQASAGVLEGDFYDMEFIARDGAKAIITGQSYTKLFKMDNGAARQRVKIKVEKNAVLYYLPKPVIPFKDSEFINLNEFYLDKGARFATQDIFACGRKGMGERFQFRKYHSRSLAFEDNELVFADNARLAPSEADISGIGYFEGYTHQGTAYFYGFDDITAPEGDSPLCAVTKAKKGALARFLGDSGEEIENCIQNMLNGGDNYGV